VLASRDFRRFLLLAGSLYLGTTAYLLINGLALFPGDFIAWFYPFRAYEPFASRGPFLDNLGYQDVVNCFFPYRSFVGHAVAQGHFPLWNPLEGAGLPPGALHSNGSYFPLHWLSYAVLPQLLAWHFDLSIQYFTAVIGSYLLFRRWSGSHQGAVLGALSWTLAGWHGAFLLEPPLTWPLALFPWVFLGLDEIAEGRWKGIPVVGLSIAGSLLVGHLQVTVVAAVLIAGFIAFNKKGEKATQLLACTFGVMLAAPHLFQLVELAGLNNRESLPKEVVLDLLLSPREFLGMFWQNIMGSPADGFYLGRSLSSLVVDGREHALYTGIFTLLLALLAVARLRHRRPVQITAALSCSALMLAGVPLIYGTLATIFPKILFVTPLRFLPFVMFGLCYLASLGWTALCQKPLTKNEIIGFGVLLGGLVFWLLTYVVPATQGTPGFTSWLVELAQKDGISKPPYFEGDFGPIFLQRVTEHLSLSSFAVWFPFALLFSGCLAYAYIPRAKLFPVFLALTLLDLTVYFFTMNVPVDNGLYYQKTPEIKQLAQGTTLSPDGSSVPKRVIGAGRGLHPSMLLPYGIANFESYQSLFPSSYRDIFRQLNGERSLSPIIASTTDRSGLTPGLLDLFGVKTLYDQPAAQDRGTERPQLTFEPRDTALRSFLSNRFRVVTNNQDIYLPDFDPRAEVLLEKTPDFEPGPTPFFKEVEPVYYGYNRVEYHLNMPEDGLLVLTDLHYPGWTVTVDGVPQDLLRAYGFVRAVAVKAGERKVVMSFWPTHWTLSWFVFLLGLAGLTGLSLRRRS